MVRFTKAAFIWSTAEKKWNIVKYYYNLKYLFYVNIFGSLLRSSNLNQIIRDPCSEVTIWIMIYEPSLQIRFNSWNDSWTRFEVLIWIKWFVNPLRSSDLNQMIREPASKFWSESNDSWHASFDQIIHQPRSDRNQMIHNPIGALLISESFCDAIVKLIQSLENL